MGILPIWNCQDTVYYHPGGKFYHPKLMFCVYGQPLLYLESTHVTSKCPQTNVSINYVNAVQKYLSGQVPKTVLLVYVNVTVKFPPSSCMR